MTSSKDTQLSVQDSILELENARYDAMMRADTTRFAQLAHPRLVYTHSNAEVDNLTSYIGKIESGHYVYHHIDHPVNDVIVAGDTAIVVGSMKADITAGGTRKRLDNTSIAVWHHDGERWLLLAYQPTVNPQVPS